MDDLAAQVTPWAAFSLAPPHARGRHELLPRTKKGRAAEQRALIAAYHQPPAAAASSADLVGSEVLAIVPHYTYPNAQAPDGSPRWLRPLYPGGAILCCTTARADRVPRIILSFNQEGSTIAA